VTRYVSLSTDANAMYSVYAPIVARLWKRLGYEPLMFLHDEHWDSDYCQYVRTKLTETVPLERQCEVSAAPPFGVPNTMRIVRLVGAAFPFIRPDDLVLTADVDMAPISRTWFNRPWSAFCLRGDMQGSYEGGKRPRPQKDGSYLQAGEFRFAMCYIGLLARIWHEILPLYAGDPRTSLKQVAYGAGYDAHDHDEAYVSYRLLRSRWAEGPLERVNEHARLWRQGELHLVSAIRPDGLPEGMLLGHEGRLPAPQGTIDFHLPRPAQYWVGDALAGLWLEDAQWIREYWRGVQERLVLL